MTGGLRTFSKGSWRFDAESYALSRMSKTHVVDGPNAEVSESVQCMDHAMFRLLDSRASSRGLFGKRTDMTTFLNLRPATSGSLGSVQLLLRPTLQLTVSISWMQRIRDWSWRRHVARILHPGRCCCTSSLTADQIGDSDGVYLPGSREHHRL